MSEEDRKIMNRYADSFEDYLDILDTKLIIEGLSQEQYDESVKMFKELIKKLRKGKSKSLDVEAFYEMKEAGLLDLWKL